MNISEEEAYNNIKKSVEAINTRPYATKVEYEKVECIKVLLTAYEKEKDKNKKLQDKAKELIFEKQELTSALLDSTPNDKIKAKIEELEKEYKEAYNKGFKTDMVNRLREIKLMQSLLEKE